MCDVVFITPTMREDASDEVIGTLQLATILNQQGISCEILQFLRIGNLSSFDDFLNNTIKFIEKNKPKIVSFYTRCDTYHIDIKLAERIKQHRNQIYIVFGGPQSDITAVQTVEQIPWVDFVCCGEGESTVYPFFSSLLNGNPNLNIPGLVYRKDGNVKKNEKPILIQNLDEIPLIDYSLFNYSKKDGDIFPIDVGRGCPFGCTYCSTKTFWGRKYRLKSPQRIFQEIKAVHEHYGVTQFGFAHDMFTLNRDKVIETCRLLCTLSFPIEWRCSARLDCIDKELIDIMADAGMTSMYVGIETGSPRMQKIANKNLKLDNVLDIISYIKAKGIGITTSFIYGFPEETEEDLSCTIDLIRELLKLKVDNVQTHLCAFLSGTELTEKYYPVLTRTNQYSNQTGAYAVKECEDLFNTYPDLFTQMYEYKTELRKKLQYFNLFIAVWKDMQPVYQYISEKYPKERLIDMYYDFVHSNKEFLNQVNTVSIRQWIKPLEAEDRFLERFADDCNFDLISDYSRMHNLQFSDTVMNGGCITDAFCFAPTEKNRCTYLQDYKRTFTIVTFRKGGNGKVKMIYETTPSI